MQFDENDSEPLGFTELNGPDLHDAVGTRYGKSAKMCQMRVISNSMYRNTIEVS
jgi:hypothetical protein